MGEQNKMISLHDNHGDKFVKLRSAMDEWSRKNAGISIDSPKGRQYSTDWDRYLKLSELFKFHKPDFIFYQCGVDILKSDKLGKLNISIEGCLE